MKSFAGLMPSRRTVLAIVGLVWQLPTATAGSEPFQFGLRRGVVDKTLASFASQQTHDPTRVVLKFAERTRVRLREEELRSLAGADIEDVVAYLRSIAGLGISRYFPRDESLFDAEKQAAERRSNASLPDLNLYYLLALPETTTLADATLIVNRLNQFDQVEIAYIRPLEFDTDVASVGGRVVPIREAVARPPAGLDVTPDFTDLQGYLFDPEPGVNAPYAWTVPGGRGEGVFIIDVERGWNWNHEDLPQPFFHDPANPPPSDVNHGTAVLGELGGKNNGFGVLGIVHAAALGGANRLDAGSAAAVNLAAANLPVGGFILIEVQVSGPGGFLPMEWEQATFDATLSATAAGKHVVAAGGNGSRNLDDPIYNNAFNRGFRDSGAVIVGAGTPLTHVAESFSNYGSRMDANGWGSSVTSTGYGDLYNGGGTNSWYTDGFSGTSSASPIVTGSAAAVQGVALAGGPGNLPPLDLRQLITDTGTPHRDPTRNIGPRPNLEAAINALLSLSGDLDGDGDVDLSDFTIFQLCFGGSNNPPAPTCPPGVDADLDGDGDVDLADFLIFQQNFTGSL